MSWKSQLLPVPKTFTRARALGFCGGHAVGMVESSNGKSQACWWPDGKHELLALGAYKELQVLSARGDCINPHFISRDDLRTRFPFSS